MTKEEMDWKFEQFLREVLKFVHHNEGLKGSVNPRGGNKRGTEHLPYSPAIRTGENGERIFRFDYVGLRKECRWYRNELINALMEQWKKHELRPNHIHKSRGANKGKRGRGNAGSNRVPEGKPEA